MRGQQLFLFSWSQSLGCFVRYVKPHAHTWIHTQSPGVLKWALQHARSLTSVSAQQHLPVNPTRTFCFIERVLLPVILVASYVALFQENHYKTKGYKALAGSLG